MQIGHDHLSTEKRGAAAATAVVFEGVSAPACCFRPVAVGPSFRLGPSFCLPYSLPIKLKFVVIVFGHHCHTSTPNALEVLSWCPRPFKSKTIRRDPTQVRAAPCELGAPKGELMASPNMLTKHARLSHG